MPYGRRRRYYGRRRKQGFRRKYIGRAGQYARTAFDAWKLAKYAVSMLNVEKKFFDVTAFSGTAIDNAGAIVSLTSIPSQEAAVDQGESRDGDQVRLKSLLLRMSALVNASATATNLRIMVLCDKMSLATPPVMTDILESASVTSPMNLANRMRFRMLYDKVFNLVPTTDKASFFSKPFFRLSSKLVWASDTTDEAQANNYYIVAISSEPTNTPTLTVESRVRFVDN